MMKPIEIKRGDSFSQIIGVSEIFSEGYFRGWEVTSTLRAIKGDKLVAPLEVEWVDPISTRWIHLKAMDTSSWPFGKAALDIQFKRASDGHTISSETLYVVISKDMTY